MAMIDCPECGERKSGQALTCPKCGFNAHKQREPAILAFVIAAIILVPIALKFLLFSD
jgi:uncharacterized paraquat-inducible protein A